MSQTKAQLIDPVDGSITGADLATNIDLIDNQIIRFGAGNDLQIYHNGSTNIIDAATSNAISFRRGNSEQFFIGDAEFKGGDNKKIKLGTSDDLQIFHDGTNSFINNFVGNLELRPKSGEVGLQMVPNGTSKIYFDGSKKLETTSAGVQVTGALNVTTTMHIPDGSIGLQVGNSNDLKIYHNGTHSFIQESGTGNLMVATSAFQVTNADVSETMIYAVADGAVNLYHNNSKKLETYANGVVITGTVAPSSINLNDNAIAYFGTGADLQIYHDGTDSRINNATGNLTIAADDIRMRGDGADEHMAKFIKNGAVELYYDNTKKFETNAEGVRINGFLELLDNQRIQLGDGDDLHIYHDGSNSRISDNGTGNLILDGNEVVIQSNDNSETQARFITNGAVELYHNNVKSARTINTGSNGLLVGDDAHINASINHGELIVRKDLSSPNQPSITQCARATIITNEQTAGVNGYGGALFFGGQDVDASDQYTVDLAAIGATTNGADIGNASASGFLDFYTRNGGAFGHKFRIENDGDLLGTDTSIGSLSDSRLKENIEDFTFDINKFKQFKPKLFNWKHPEYHRDTPASGKHRGFIAQDIEVIDSELVSTYRIPKDNPEGALVDQITLETEEYKEVVAEGKTANLGRIDAMYISVINQLIAKVEALETKVAALEAA